MNCAEVDKRILDFIYHSMEGSVRAEFEQHLQDCPGCKQMVKDFAGIRGLYAQIKKEDVSRQTDAAILKQAHKIKPKGNGLFEFLRPLFSQPQAFGMGVAVVLAILIFNFYNYDYKFVSERTALNIKQKTSAVSSRILKGRKEVGGLGEKALSPNEGADKGKMAVQLAAQSQQNKHNPDFKANVVKANLASPTNVVASSPATKEGIPQKWAVIIGISSYLDSRIPSIRYASADAQAFYEWVISPRAGKYDPARVKLLIDEKATGQNIKDALFIWLKQAKEDDLVTIYFAGHGTPESPIHPENLFLVTYDTQFDKLASTSFPLWNVEASLKRFIKAKKVVVIADACRREGIGQSFLVARRSHLDVLGNPISSALEDLSKISEGICVISASNDRNFSQEGEKWGGGHGVFTYYLIKGLNKEADYNYDETVTLDELILYLSEQVRAATEEAQNPSFAGKFGLKLSIQTD